MNLSTFVALTTEKKPLAVFSSVIQAINFYGGIIPNGVFLGSCEMIESADYLVFIPQTGAEPFFSEADTFESFPIIFQEGGGREQVQG